MKKTPLIVLVNRRKELKASIEALLLKRPVDVGIQWQASHEELSEITVEIQRRLDLGEVIL